MQAKPQKEHEWLNKLIGEWTTEAEMTGPDSSEKCTGSEAVRSMGGLWVLCEGRGEMPGGAVGTMLMTLGYNPEKKRYVGTWVGSMMTTLWVYDGSLDESEKILTLNADGPSFTDPTKTTKYQDIIEFKSDDHRTLTSRALNDDGTWTQFMVAHYRRKK